jgi:hypothetical protein
MPGYWKPAWEDLYYLRLRCHEYGQRMIFGVSREKNRAGEKPPASEELLNAVRKVQPSARINPWWAVRIIMRTPAADWRKPGVLWQMHKDNKFLEDVAEQLLQVATISEPVVDQLAQKKRPI